MVGGYSTQHHPTRTQTPPSTNQHQPVCNSPTPPNTTSPHPTGSQPTQPTPSLPTPTRSTSLPSPPHTLHHLTLPTRPCHDTIPHKYTTTGHPVPPHLTAPLKPTTYARQHFTPLSRSAPSADQVRPPAYPTHEPTQHHPYALPYTPPKPAGLRAHSTHGQAVIHSERPVSGSNSAPVNVRTPSTRHRLLNQERSHPRVLPLPAGSANSNRTTSGQSLRLASGSSLRSTSGSSSRNSTNFGRMEVRTRCSSSSKVHFAAPGVLISVPDIGIPLGAIQLRPQTPPSSLSPDTPRAHSPRVNSERLGARAQATRYWQPERRSCSASSRRSAQGGCGASNYTRQGVSASHSAPNRGGGADLSVSVRAREYTYGARPRSMPSIVFRVRPMSASTGPGSKSARGSRSSASCMSQSV